MKFIKYFQLTANTSVEYAKSYKVESYTGSYKDLSPN